MLQTTSISTLRRLALIGLLSAAAAQAPAQVVLGVGCTPKSGGLCRLATQMGQAQNQVATATNTVNATTAVTVQAVGAAQRAKDAANALSSGSMTTMLPQTAAPGTRRP